MKQLDWRAASACRAAVTAVVLLVTIQTPAAGQEPAQAPAWDDEPTWSADSPRPSDDPNSKRPGDDSWVSVRGGIGFTAGPDSFLMSLEVPFTIMELVSVGPQLRLGVSDDNVYFAPTVQAYITPRLGGDLDDLRPYASFGMGLAVLEKDDRCCGRDEEDVDFLLTPGFGLEYRFDQFFVGSNMQLDIIPGGVAGQRFIYTWQILTFRAAF